MKYGSLLGCLFLFLLPRFETQGIKLDEKEEVYTTIVIGISVYEHDISVFGCDSIKMDNAWKYEQMSMNNMYVLYK